MSLAFRAIPRPAIGPFTGGSRKERGVALVIGLIFMLITALMAVTAMSGVIMQERMAGNLKNSSVASAGAESALRVGEHWLRNYHLTSAGDKIIGDRTASLGVYDYQGGDPIAVIEGPTTGLRTAKTWNDTPGGAVRFYPVALISDADLGDADGGNMAARPQYVIEDMGPLRPTGSIGKESGAEDAEGGYGSSGGCPARVYRITARSTGSSRNVMRVAESTYAGCTGS